ncbi:MAG TPA: carboxypeptidase regulatory-like domain-containing protein [Bryobacteraceae bacterium]|nr:carboxypeptidase regulatory-like domain-containing protein [Bryobacteraceae bacterium]
MQATHRSLLLTFLSCLLVACLVIPTLGWGQEVTAAITGQVTDPTGAPIANAKVVAKDTQRGTVWTAQTNELGFYNLPRVPVGNYQVTVEAQGFQTAVHPPFDLSLNQTARLDFPMKIGAVSTQVEVTSSAPLLQTDTTQVSTVMESSSIISLPLETRNYNQLALLTPGAVTTSPGAFNTGQTTFNSGRPYINGNREQANYYLLDGMDNNEFVDNNVAYSPNVDAIQEFNVITNNPNATFGQFLGGVISVSTKSGTNQYHGNVFEFVRNDALNANEWANNFQGLPKAALNWNEFGGTFGGHIKKDKLFFFGDYQGSRFDQPATVNHITTFTSQDLTANLSDVPNISLHYPGTTVAMPADLTKATICGAGQKMGVNPCITGISPTALKIMGALPKAGSSAALNNADNSVNTFIHGNQGDLKMDWNASEKDHVFARYTQQHIENPTVNSQPLLYNGTGDNVFPLWNGVIDYTRTFTPTFVNEMRAGVNYYPAGANLQSLTTNAGANLIPGQPTAFMPGFWFSGPGALGGVQNGPFAFGTVDSPEIFHQTTIQYEDTANWVHANHTFTMGFQAIRYRNDYVPAVSNDGAAGQIGFTGGYTGNTEADFLLGLPAYMGYGIGAAGTVGQRNNAFGAFFQDDWRVNSHLTLNLGIRWQLFTPIYEVHDRMTNFGEISGQIELAGQNGNSRALYNQYNGIANFLPRLGLAWTPWGNNTVIRAAFSRSSFQEGTGEYNRLATNAPWNIDLVGQFVPGVNGAIPSNQVTLDQGFTALGGAIGGTPCNVNTIASVPASCFQGVRLHMQDPNYRPAVSNQWNLTLQRQIGNALTLQAGYVGQHTDHLASILDAGQAFLQPNGTVIPGPYLSGNPALKNIGTGQVRLNSTIGRQNYNALQLTAQQRLSHGFAYQFNYVWSKCLTNNQGYYGRYGDATGSQASADVAFQQNVYNINQDYGLCDHDVTNVFNGYVNYDLPYGKNRTYGKDGNKVVNAILGDWSVNAIVTIHGGFPISMLDWAGDPGTGSFQPRPDCISPSKQTPFNNFAQFDANGAPIQATGGYRWFDPSTMRDPAPGHFGNCGVSTERGPGIRQFDLGVSKFFPITERQKVEFRFEAINALNTPIFVVQGYQIDVHGSPLEGVVNQSLGSRNLQFGLKYSF